MNKIWIELEKPKDKEHADLQCTLANRVLERMGAKGQSFFYSQRLALYCIESSPGGTYKELTDNGEWFNLDYLGREVDS